MRYLIILLSMMCGVANAQLNDNRIFANRGTFGANLNIPRYADTTAANLNLGIDSCGAIIYTYAGNKVYKRNCSPKAWAEMGSTGGGITGSGTANYVAYWTGSSALGSDADFQFDGTNVGLGGASAAARLQVTASGGTFWNSYDPALSLRAANPGLQLVNTANTAGWQFGCEPGNRVLYIVNITASTPTNWIRFNAAGDESAHAFAHNTFGSTSTTTFGVGIATDLGIGSVPFNSAFNYNDSGLHWNASTTRLERKISTTSSTYTPTITNTTNITSSSANVTGWYRVGNTVTVFGQVTVTATADLSESELGVSLPVASAITQVYQGGGTGVFRDNAVSPVDIEMDVTNDRAKFHWIPKVDSSPIVLTFTFSYQVL